MRRCIVFLSLCWGLCWAGACFASGAYQETIARLPLHAKASVQRLYAGEVGPLWQPQQYRQLQAAIEASADDGLIPDHYHRRALAAASSEPLRDVLASDAYLSLAAHLLAGKLDPVSMESTWTAAGRQRDLVAHLHKALDSGDIAGSLRELLPSQPRYQRLKAALRRYRQQQAEGPWPQLPVSALLKPGQALPWVAQLRESLQRRGDLVPGAVEVQPQVYDESLVEAVKRFQRRANLEPDGIVGPATLRELNRGPSERIDQLRVNLERWRWLPDDLGKQHLRVNIADYQLEVHMGSDVAVVHDVVVGRNQRQTPIFSSKMSYLVFNPWWETPAKLARLDLLPKFQARPELVAELGYQVLSPDGKILDARSIDWHRYSAKHFPLRLRQAPGKHNALGAVKFMFPNMHAVYLHDTPSKELFAKTRRDFSSGCIRVQNPIDLAEWLLQSKGDWPRSRIEAVLAMGRETTVTLAEKIPVHLLYWTVVADDDSGDVRFIEDIYSRDARVLAALNQPSSERK